MLDAARVEPGMRVLEIGTGTGYTAALLAHRPGPANVTTIEIDPRLAERAKAALATAGYGEVSVLTADGALGHPQAAPFDRVLSTVAAAQVPYHWMAQTRPGGLVVTPWCSAYKHAGLLTLTVGEDGTASGSLVNTTISFMELRDQRLPRATVTEVVHSTDAPALTETKLHASHVCKDEAAFAIGVQVPGCQWEYLPPTRDDGRWCVWFLDPDSRSWARFGYEPDLYPYQVCQFGSRRLWNEIETAYRRWDSAGCPKPTEWRFVITPDGQNIRPPVRSRSIQLPLADDPDIAH